jgi:hypothetical protein
MKTAAFNKIVNKVCYSTVIPNFSYGAIREGLCAGLSFFCLYRFFQLFQPV